MKIFSTLPKRSYVVVATVLTLLSVFAYYFWVYLPAREELLVAKRVRALQQIANSFKEKDLVYRKTANSIYDKKNIKEIISTKQNEDSQVAAKLMVKLAGDQVNPNLIFVNNTFKDTLEMEYPPGEELKLDNPQGIKLISSLETFFEPFKRADSFDNYLLFKGNTLAYSTVDGEVLQLAASTSSATIAFNIDSLLSSSDKKNVRIRLDRSEKEPEIFEPGLNIKLSAIDYKLFSTHLKTYDDKSWTLYALVNAESFEADMKEVPVMVIIIIAIVLMILIFALPLIKLSLISPIERLHRVDVVLSTSSFVICTGLMILFLLFATSYQADRETIDAELYALSENLENNVQSELQGISETISGIEEEVYDQKEGESLTDINIFTRQNFSEKLKGYPFLKNLYWMNATGDYIYQLSTVTPKNKLVEPVNFGERDYFREIAEGRGWKFDEIFEGRPFYLQSISSWTNSEKLMVVSLPTLKDTIKLPDNSTKKASVLAASVRFHSFIDPLLPAAFSFCVIDENGQVLFHSDKEKNLQENFVAEVDEHKGVLSAMIGKSSLYANVNIGGNEQRIFIRPLVHTPWMLLTSYEEAYSEAPYLQVISLNVICILIIGAMAFFQLYLISLFDRRTSKLKKQTFYYDWLWPLAGKREQYYKVMLYNVVLAGVLCVYHLIFELSVFQVLASFLYAILFASSSTWVLLADASKRTKSRSNTVLGFTMLVCLLIFGMTSYFTQAWFTNFSILVLVAVLSLLPHLPVRKFYKGPLKLKRNIGFRKAYWGMLFTYLFISSVLPTFFLYSTAYEQEQKIWKKHEMYTISKAEEDRNQLMKKLYSLNNASDIQRENLIHTYGKEEARFEQAKAIGNYYQCLGYQTCDCKNTLPLMSTRGDSLLYRSRPFFTSMFVASSGFVFSKGGDEWETRRCDVHGIRMKYHSINHTAEDSVILASSVKGLAWNYAPGSLSGEFFWIGLLALLLAVYHIIRFATIKFFALKLFNNLQAIQVDDAYLETYFDGRQDDGHKHLFVIALPFAGTHRLYGKKHLQVFDVPQLLDKDECAKILQISNSQVVLEHFSYVIEDTEANKQILDIVERLLRNHNNIIIVSRLSPTQIIDKYEERLSQVRDAGQRAVLEVQVSKWKDILAGFVKVFYSLLHEDTLKQQYSDDFSIKQLLAYEFRVNEPYFKRIREAFTRKWGVGKIELTAALEKIDQEQEDSPLKHLDVKEEVLLKIQSMAQPFYYSLWNTCSKEEKYLLYDLAMDGFVNTQNERGLKKLLEKGLIYYQESLQVMNESFRNFILSTIKESESLAMEKELRRSGNWSLYSSIFLILLVSLIVFVSLSQQEIISQFVALLVGLTTAIPYLLRFSGFFSAFSGKNKAASAA